MVLAATFPDAARAHTCSGCSDQVCKFGCGGDLQDALDYFRSTCSTNQNPVVTLEFDPNLTGGAACTTCVTDACGGLLCTIDLGDGDFDTTCGSSLGNERMYCITKSNLTIDGKNQVRFRYVGEGDCAADTPPSYLAPGDCNDPQIAPRCRQPQLFDIRSQNNTVRNLRMEYFPEGIHLRGANSSGNSVSGIISARVCEDAISVREGQSHTIGTVRFTGYTEPDTGHECLDSTGSPAPCGLDKAIQILGASGAIAGTAQQPVGLHAFRAPVRINNTRNANSAIFYQGDWNLSHVQANHLAPPAGCPGYPDAGLFDSTELQNEGGIPTVSVGEFQRGCAHVCQGFEFDEMLDEEGSERYFVNVDDSDIRHCLYGIRAESGARVRVRNSRLQHNYRGGVQVYAGTTTTASGVNVQLLAQNNILKQNGYVYGPLLSDPDCETGNVIVGTGNGATPDDTRLDFGGGDHNLQSVFESQSCAQVAGDGVDCSAGSNVSCQEIDDTDLEEKLDRTRLVDIANCGSGLVGASIGFQTTQAETTSVEWQIFDDDAPNTNCGAFTPFSSLTLPTPSTCPVSIRCGDNATDFPLSGQGSSGWNECYPSPVAHSCE